MTACDTDVVIGTTTQTAETEPTTESREASASDPPNSSTGGGLAIASDGASAHGQPNVRTRESRVNYKGDEYVRREYLADDDDEVIYTELLTE